VLGGKEGPTLFHETRGQFLLWQREGGFSPVLSNDPKKRSKKGGEKGIEGLVKKKDIKRLPICLRKLAREGRKEGGLFSGPRERGGRIGGKRKR